MKYLAILFLLFSGCVSYDKSTCRCGGEVCECVKCTCKDCNCQLKNLHILLINDIGQQESVRSFEYKNTLPKVYFYDKVLYCEVGEYTLTLLPEGKVFGASSKNSNYIAWKPMDKITECYYNGKVENGSSTK